MLGPTNGTGGPVLAGRALAGLPLLWPATVLALLVAGALSGPLARRLGAPRWVAFLLLASAGGVLAATLTPAEIPAYRISAGGFWLGDTCQVTRPRLPAWSELTSPTETSLNVAMLVPLGVSCALLPRWRQIPVAVLASALLPPAVEAVQGLLPPLGRVCSSDDVVTNLIGLGTGVVAGLILLRPVHLLLAAAPPGERRTGSPVPTRPVSGGRPAPGHRPAAYRTDGFPTVTVRSGEGRSRVSER